jgi:hypothetical protein
LKKDHGMADDRPQTWKVVLAALLDFALVFALGGYLVALLTGSVTETGFQLTGGPALLWLVLAVGYFWGLKRAGGTLFQRLFGIAGKLR